MGRYWLLVAWVISNPAWAATGIDAGSLLQQIERDRREPLQRPETSGIAPLEAPASGSEQDRTLHFTVQKVALLNVTAFDEAKLLELLADTIGQSVSLAELRERIKRISVYYHAQGYPAAYVYLPEQTIGEDGVVEVRVLEGYLGEIRLNNQSRLTDRTARVRIPNMRAGDILQQKPLVRSAILLNEIPGVRAQTALNPGRDPGFTDVDITLVDTPLLTTELSVDNQGSRYTGDGTRLSIRPEISNITGYGDRLTVNYLYGGFGMRYSQLHYQIPTYWTGVGRAGIEHSEVEYRVGRELVASGSQGVTRTNALYGNYPVIRSDVINLNLELRYQEKMIRDQVRSVNDNNERKSNCQVLTASGDWRDGAINLWSLAYTNGQLNLIDRTHLAIDAASARTAGKFSKVNWSYTRLQGISGTDNFSLIIAINGQLDTGRNLDPSEKMVLGGAHGVRAYPSSEGMSDQATLATIELNHQFNPNLQFSAFYDYGIGVQNIAPWPAVAGTNQSALGGVGVGFRFKFGNSASLSMQSAWRTTRTKPTSGNDKPGGRYWLELGWGI